MADDDFYKIEFARNEKLDKKRLFKYTSFTKELLNDEDIETNRERARQNGYRMILEV